MIECLPPTTCHMSHVACYVSHVHVTCDMSRVMCHMSHVTSFFFWTKWSLSVEGLVSTGPTRLVCVISKNKFFSLARETLVTEKFLFAVPNVKITPISIICKRECSVAMELKPLNVYKIQHKIKLIFLCFSKKTKLDWLAAIFTALVVTL